MAHDMYPWKERRCWSKARVSLCCFDEEGCVLWCRNGWGISAHRPGACGRPARYGVDRGRYAVANSPLLGIGSRRVCMQRRLRRRYRQRYTTSRFHYVSTCVHGVCAFVLVPVRIPQVRRSWLSIIQQQSLRLPIYLFTVGSNSK